MSVLRKFGAFLKPKKKVYVEGENDGQLQSTKKGFFSSFWKSKKTNLSRFFTRKKKNNLVAVSNAFRSSISKYQQDLDVEEEKDELVQEKVEIEEPERTNSTFSSKFSKLRKGSKAYMKKMAAKITIAEPPREPREREEMQKEEKQMRRYILAVAEAKERKLMSMDEEHLKSVIRTKRVLKRFFKPENSHLFIHLYRFLPFPTVGSCSMANGLLASVTSMYFSHHLPCPRPWRYLTFWFFRSAELPSRVFSYLEMDERINLSVLNRHICQVVYRLPISIAGSYQMKYFLESNLFSTTRELTIERIDGKQLVSFNQNVQEGKYPSLNSIYIGHISSRPVGWNMAQLIQNLLQKSIHRLALPSVGLETSDLIQFATLISTQSFPALQALDLSGNVLTIDSIYRISKALSYKGLSNLTTLSLSNCQFGDKLMKRLCELISLFVALDQLDLSFNKIGETGATYLAQVFSKRNLLRLKVFKYSSNAIEKRSMEILVQSWFSNVYYRLETLDLSGNTFGGKSSFVLARVLQHGSFPGLTNLFLLNCSVESVILSKAFASQPVDTFDSIFPPVRFLRILNLSRNKIHIESFCDALASESFESLTNLNLSANHIDILGFYRLAQTFQYDCLPNLQHLDLSQNKATTDGIYRFLPFFSSPIAQHLWSLNLQRNFIDHVGLQRISEAMRSGHLILLHQLDLSQNATLDNMIHFHDTIRSFCCPSLSSLQIGPYVSYLDGIQLIHQALQTIPPAELHQLKAKRRQEIWETTCQRELQRKEVKLRAIARQQDDTIRRLDQTLSDTMAKRTRRGPVVSPLRKMLQSQSKQRRLDRTMLKMKQIEDREGFTRTELDARNDFQHEQHEEAFALRYQHYFQREQEAKEQCFN